MMDSVEWIVLGSSSGNPSKERACSGYLLSVDGKLILFDCGSGVTANFLRFGYDPLKVEAIFISHAHSDHLSDLAVFIQLLYLLKREKELKLFLPEELIPIYRQFLNAVYLFPNKFPFHLNLRPIQPGNALDININVLAHPTSHLNAKINQDIIILNNLPNKMESYAFEIALPDNRRIFYSSDIGNLADISPSINQTDLLVIETAHINLAALPDLLDINKIGRVILTHYGDESFSVLSEFVAGYNGKTELLIASDGMIAAI